MFGFLNPAAAPHSRWNDRALIREEVFSAERLERLAESVARKADEAGPSQHVRSLASRMKENSLALREACRVLAVAAQSGATLEPAAGRFLDNYHLIDEQIRAARDELSPQLYKRLPKCATGGLAGYPRLLTLVWSFVAHTDSHVELPTLNRYCVAFQKVRPLTIGELRALPAMLRFVLIENTRRLADELIEDRELRASADRLADLLLGAGAYEALPIDASDDPPPDMLSDVALAQLAKRLHDQDPHVASAQRWLERLFAARAATVDEIVRNAHRRHGAGNVTLRNIIASMRLISDDDWSAFLGSISVVDDAFRRGSAFALMDFDTRNLYRDAIEVLARGSGLAESSVVEQVRSAIERSPESADSEAQQDPGFLLIGNGRENFERAIGFRRNLKQSVEDAVWRCRRILYIVALVALSVLVLALMLYVSNVRPSGSIWTLLLMLFGLLPASDAAFTLVNRAVVGIVGPKHLPGLELADGVPSGLRTLVVIPNLLTTAEDLERSILDLEVHYLGNRGGELTFALLMDGRDADSETVPGEDALYASADVTIAALNNKYGRSPAGDRFLLLRRRRLFNQSQNCWMGWERKRGKLHELNRLLRGATDTTYSNGEATPFVPKGVRYVITLDADTRLPRGSLNRLIGKMAHPLNRPRFDAKAERIVEGYAILQPRVTPSLPAGEDATIYQWAFANPGGVDPYAGAVSDVYQDLFGEGTYTGKGIYDVDAFEGALANRIPENSLLSHDLYEGSIARAGLASDIEFVESFPSRYDVAVRRQHRWARGDWQLLPFMLASAGEHARPLSGLAIWKMLDNLRRTLSAPFTLAALMIGWMGPPRVAWVWSLAIIGALALPLLSPPILDLVPRLRGDARRGRWRTARADLKYAAVNTALSLIFLADQTYRMTDAIVRALFRVYVSRRNLLEWVTAAQAASSPELDLAGFARHMLGGSAVALAAGGVAASVAPNSLPVIVLFVAAWCPAPAIAMLVSRRTIDRSSELTAEQVRALRQIARRTWRYFETYTTPAENMLPPDNFQETPMPVVARRTSPTNLGLHLVSAVAARDFGWAGQMEIVERLEQALSAMAKLKRYRGHFYNWYETAHMEVLAPAYVSTVDSGNLAANLIVLANACREWQRGLISPEHIRKGLDDNLMLAREALALMPRSSEDNLQSKLETLFAKFATALQDPRPIDIVLEGLKPLGDQAIGLARQMSRDLGGELSADLLFWTQALVKAIGGHRADVRLPPLVVNARLSELEKTAREMAMAMEFDFLFEPQRKLLSIGFSVPDNRLDPNCYDLLASEASVACLFAIAKGDISFRLWSRLGRRAVDVDGGFALLSWSGSMFEYLMAGLMVRAPINSLLHQCSLAIVARQRSYARRLGIPWGISESAFNVRDLAFNYQYQAFGVPDLAMKRGLASSAVVAPYATGLAAMVDPGAALVNFSALANIGALGRCGFYEAVDFTRSRLPEGETCATIRSYMAHHQGMTIVAIANALHRGRMRDRFHIEPMIQACELLLHEPATREAVAANPIEEIKVAPTQIDIEAIVERRLEPPSELSPQTHILSNGSYAVMLTSAGSGYSRWRNLAVTRWREDPTQDNWGTYIFARDVTRNAQDGSVWSATYQPGGSPPDHYEVVFSEDRAEFKRVDGPLTTTLEIIVTSDANADVRRVTIASNGRGVREVELTSYCEIVLADPAADTAHPAFSKMFIETEHLPDSRVILATRRRRSPEDPALWAAHFAVVEGRATAVASFETDRARFLGRGGTIADAAAIAQAGPLSDTFGAVLDPIFALRQRVLVPPSGSVRVAFWTIVAPSRDEILALIDARLDADAFDRARIHAWTRTQVALRHLNIAPGEALHFQRLAGFLLYADPRFRPSSETIVRGAGSQTELWRHGISGDLPIVLVRIDDIVDFGVVNQLIRACEFWREKLLRVDLVILNERTASYAQDLQNAIEAAARASLSVRRNGEPPGEGAIFTLRADVIGAESRDHLLSTARVTLVARRGDIARQIAQCRCPLSPKEIGAPPNHREK